MTPPGNKTGPAGVFETRRRHAREAAPRIARALSVLIVTFLVFAFFWASQTEMKELVRAEGEIAPRGELRRVDHFDGGLIAEVHAAEGARVEKDQPLVRIEHPGLSDRIAELMAERAALMKSMADALWLLNGEGDGEMPPDISAQRELFATQQELMRRRADRLTRASDIAAELRDNARAHLALSEASFERIRRLQERGAVSQASVEAQAEQAAEIRSDYLQTEASHSRATLEALEAAAAREEALLAFRERHLKAISQLEERRDLLDVRIANLDAQRRRQIVRAPVGGIVQRAGFTTIGEVVEPGGLLFELLPSDERLVAVVKIDPRDVGHIREGSAVVLKVATYDARRFGDVRGSIEQISPTSVTPDRGGAFYKAVVALETQTIGPRGDARPLRAGMTLTAEVETAKRSVLMYLLKPVQRVIDQALTER